MKLVKLSAIALSASLVACASTHKAEAPAPQVVSAPAPAKQSAASDNDGNSGTSRGGHTGARGKHAS
jgi:cytochrome c5